MAFISRRNRRHLQISGPKHRVIRENVAEKQRTLLLFLQVFDGDTPHVLFVVPIDFGLQCTEIASYLEFGGTSGNWEI